MKNLKKKFGIVLMMLVLVCAMTGALSVTAAAKSSGMKVGSTFTVGQYKYKVTSLKGKTGSVSLIGKSVKTVNVPNTVKNGKYRFNVTAIASNAFKGCKKLKTVTTNKNLKTIGKNAFSGSYLS